jgi:hypothetical protein
VPPSAVLSSAVPPSGVAPSAVAPDAVLSSAVQPSAVLSSVVPPSAVLSSAVPPSAVLSSVVPPSALLSSHVPPSAVPSSSVKPSDMALSTTSSSAATPPSAVFSFQTKFKQASLAKKRKLPEGQQNVPEEQQHGRCAIPSCTRDENSPSQLCSAGCGSRVHTFCVYQLFEDHARKADAPESDSGKWLCDKCFHLDTAFQNVVCPYNVANSSAASLEDVPVQRKPKQARLQEPGVPRNVAVSVELGRGSRKKTLKCMNMKEFFNTLDFTASMR